MMMLNQCQPPSTATRMLGPVKPKRSAHKIKMPSGFVPGRFNVICGRGKLCTSSPGNMYLRSLVDQNLTAYSMARNKAEKSAIVSSIIYQVREVCPFGAFVKQEDDSDEWWEVDDSFAREKIGCIIRDILHIQYKSSTKAKSERKRTTEPCSDKAAKRKKTTAAAKPRRASSSNDSTKRSQKRNRQGQATISKQNSSPPIVRSLGSASSSDPAICQSMIPLSRTVTSDTTHPFFTNVQSCDGGISMMTPFDSFSSLRAISSEGFNNMMMRSPMFNGFQTTGTGTNVVSPMNSLWSSSSSEQVHQQQGCGADAWAQQTTVSLLQDALGIIDKDDLGCDTEDFPDDLSDIFEDDTPSSW